MECWSDAFKTNTPILHHSNLPSCASGAGLEPSLLVEFFHKSIVDQIFRF
jgi:hypothetical protein